LSPALKVSPAVASSAASSLSPALARDEDDDDKRPALPRCHGLLPKNNCHDEDEEADNDNWVD
jgi:hypothetical protein